MTAEAPPPIDVQQPPTVHLNIGRGPKTAEAFSGPASIAEDLGTTGLIGSEIEVAPVEIGTRVVVNMGRREKTIAPEETETRVHVNMGRLDFHSETTKIDRTGEAVAGDSFDDFIEHVATGGSFTADGEGRSLRYNPDTGKYTIIKADGTVGVVVGSKERVRQMFANKIAEQPGRFTF